MSATASPPKPRPSGPRPGERSMPWQCAHCRWQSTAFYQNADVDLVKCPKCKVMSIYIIGDLRELARYPEELRYVATGEEPTTEGDRSYPMGSQRKATDDGVARLLALPRGGSEPPRTSWIRRVDTADVVEALLLFMLAVAVIACFA